MNRFPTLFAGAAGLCLVLGACVPVDGNAEAPPTPVQAEETGGGFTDPSASSLPEPTLHAYSADGLEERISKLPPAMAAYRVQQGRHPFDDGQPGSERVLLAEHFTSTTRFELPGESTKDSISIELRCSNPISVSLRLIDANGTDVSTMAGSCDPDVPFGTSSGLGDVHRAAPALGHIKVSFDGDSEVAVGLVAYTRTNQD